MKLRHLKAIGLTLVLGLTTQGVSAATSNQSVAEQPRSIEDILHLTYWGNVAGPGISNFGKSETPHTDAGTMNLFSSAQIGYKLNSAEAFFANPRFLTNLVTDADRNGFGSTQWLNPRFGYKDSQMFVSESGNTSLYGNIHVELPLGDGSNTSLAIAPGFSNFLSINFSGSRWSYGQWSTLRFYIYGVKPKEAQKFLQIEFYPEMDYKISKDLTFRFLTRFEYGPNEFQGFAMDAVLDGALIAFQPGISWDIASGLNINPYVQLRPKQGFSLDSSSIGMEISGSVF